jgi:DNA polymerase elongation subunit (family B)
MFVLVTLNKLPHSLGRWYDNLNGLQVFCHILYRGFDEIMAKDKGGMIFSPRVGLHENVVVLDYGNEYANLILKHNLSYETVTSTEDERFIGNSKEKSGLLPTVLESVLKRRIFFKNLRKSFPINTNEWLEKAVIR